MERKHNFHIQIWVTFAPKPVSIIERRPSLCIWCFNWTCHDRPAEANYSIPSPNITYKQYVILDDIRYIYIYTYIHTGVPVWCDVVWYKVIWRVYIYVCVCKYLSHHNISYHVMCHMSYHTVLPHIISCHTISYQMLCCIGLSYYMISIHFTYHI